MEQEKPKMRSLQLNQKRKIEVQLVEIPTVSKNKLLVRLDFNSINSSKIMKFLDSDLSEDPVLWKPEFEGCGEVTEIGDECIKQHCIGDKVEMELITSWAQFVLVDSEKANKIPSSSPSENNNDINNKNEKCTSEKCFNNYGAVIGSNSNAPAYSNCGCSYKNKFDDYTSILPKEQTGFEKDLNVGIKWQCVEYSRRWLVLNFKVSFEDILFACQIFFLKTATDLENKTDLEFLAYKNRNKIAPQFGDLIIYPFCLGTPWGHVAVCTKVDIELGFIEISEQNFAEGAFWEHESYARRLTLLNTKNDGCYTLTDIPWDSNSKELDENQISELSSKYENSVCGWKRVLFK